MLSYGKEGSGMSDTSKLSDYIKSLSRLAAVKENMAIMSDSSGELIQSDIASLQPFVFTPRQGYNIDQPPGPGIYSLNGSTGTKPAEYGMVLSIGVYPGDVYQIAITTSNLFHRRNINGTLGSWVRVASV